MNKHPRMLIFLSLGEHAVRVEQGLHSRPRDHGGQQRLFDGQLGLRLRRRPQERAQQSPELRAFAFRDWRMALAPTPLAQPDRHNLPQV
eukprot:2407706-Lingulodinium_polyedra.AAC.1